ncbi:MAG: AAA-like domain-containing protein, partial [Armatimonadota bacterium]|nr:AAA-like domain-containing protein [Armatimonadota bacterium]
FFRDPTAPVRCAMEVAEALSSRPHLRLRMGLHSGPVYRVEDINANTNVSGGGIIIAQRVMDCGDAGHILLSSSIRELLGQVGDWPVHDLGECEVKHGFRVHLFSLHTERIGNPALPRRLRQKALELGTAGETSGTGTRVALIYKRGSPRDQHVLDLLETQLRARGFQVFVDRHLPIGVEWAKEIERQLRSVDAVVPLLSEASIHSEMLPLEVQLAYDAAQERQGRPRLLPVRVAYTGPLPDPLAAILDPLQYALWETPEDDEALVERLVEALRRPWEAPQVGSAPRLEPVGGAVPLDSKLYVVRQTDEEFRAAVARQDSIILVKGARQMGKTSLLARGLQQAREAGLRVAFTDLQKLNAAQLQTAETLFLALAEALADQLDLETLPEEEWNPRRGPNVNFERYLRRHVLAPGTAPLLWALDETDRLFGYDFAGEVFGLFRAWHNERALNPGGPWSRLSLAIAYATEAHLFITDMNQSPFNVGTRLTLHDFTLDQVADLNRRCGRPLRTDTEIERLYRLVGGQPYLVRRALHEMVSRGLDINALEAEAVRDEGLFGDHLRRMLVLLARDPELMEVVRAVLRGTPPASPDAFYRLRSAGIMAGDSPREMRPRCRLYATYLSRHLL